MLPTIAAILHQLVKKRQDMGLCSNRSILIFSISNHCVLSTCFRVCLYDYLQPADVSMVRPLHSGCVYGSCRQFYAAFSSLKCSFYYYVSLFLMRTRVVYNFDFLVNKVTGIVMTCVQWERPLNLNPVKVTTSFRHK